ncbi:hypothetical protein AAGW05_16465 [Arthrobacter sp. LAPM80]|uniref:hypothetical protein n=1 Tax=Arthrobacter sp. LAPM80 TaxID=3141788 RepID=UPI00398A5FDC
MNTKSLHRQSCPSRPPQGPAFLAGPRHLRASQEIASAGESEADLESDWCRDDMVKMSPRTNARAPMCNVNGGFIRIIARKGSEMVLGGVVVGAEPASGPFCSPLS